MAFCPKASAIELTASGVSIKGISIKIITPAILAITE
jgi:hypothetical protein